jgi:hypothetical protein
LDNDDLVNFYDNFMELTKQKDYIEMDDVKELLINY